MDVQTESGIVKVSHSNPRVTYYRGRYYRMNITTSVTPNDFRMTSRETYFGNQYALRWWATTDTQGWMFYRYDSTRCEWAAPF